MKKSIAFLLACVLLLSFASCASEPAADTTTTAAAEDTGDSGVDSKGFELDTLGNSLNYNDETVKILHWSDVERHEFGMAEEDAYATIVDEAIYTRNISTESRLHVKLEWEGTKGNNSNVNSFLNYVTSQQAGGNTYDLIASYSRTMGLLATRGLLEDLNAVDDSHLNWSKPWWPQTMLDTCTIDDSLYFCTGDISTNLLHFMYAVWYNMDLAENLHIDNPVPMVDNGTWTLANMIRLTKDLYEDNNSNGKRDEADSYGMCSEVYHLDSFWTGAGLKLVEADEEKILKISDDFSSAKAVDFVDTLGNWATSDVCFIKSGVLGSVDYFEPFIGGRALFCPNRVYIADREHYSHLNEVKWRYGVLPLPMYNEDQDRYITVIGNPVTLWGMMVGQGYDLMERNSAVLECLASYAFRLTTPALFEVNMKYKYTSGAENDGVRMFDLIRSGVTLDLGRIFSTYLQVMSEKPSEAAAKGESWASKCKSLADSLGKNLERGVVAPILELKG